jgi:hypothetical protein
VIRRQAPSLIPALALAAAAATFPAPAGAYEFSIDLRTIGQGYQVRRFAPTGGDELLTRRRLTQFLNVSVFDIEPAGWRGDGAPAAGARNVLTFDASLRFDSDFGGYTLGGGGGAAAPPHRSQTHNHDHKP